MNPVAGSGTASGVTLPVPAPKWLVCRRCHLRITGRCQVAEAVKDPVHVRVDDIGVVEPEDVAELVDRCARISGFGCVPATCQRSLSSYCTSQRMLAPMQVD